MNAVIGTSLRSWLRHLAESDRLAVMREGVDLRFQLAALSKRLDGERATLFPAPSGHAIPVLSGLVSSRAWMAEAMGVAEADLLENFQRAAREPIPWREVEDAPVQQVVHEEVDLQRLLPIPVHNEHDNGAYVTAGLLISRDPETGVQNVSINRCQISGPDHMGVLILPRDTYSFQRKAEADGKPLEVAVVVGVDPLCLLASQAIAPLGQDELEIAGALHGRPLPVVKCLSNEVRVPAEAEIVIEGHIPPDVRELEGPFGEFPQYYGAPGQHHVIRVDRVTHRRRPLYHTIVGGALEHLVLGEIPREATLLGHLKRTFPNVLDVHLPKGGVCRYHLVVRIDKRQEGEAKNIMMGAFAGHYDVKRVVVVDKDVNIYDTEEVEWAIATRFQADRDLLVIPGAQGSKLDPTTDNGFGAKMGLDATVPLAADPFTFTRIRVPGEAEIVPAEHLDEAADPLAWLAEAGP